MAGIWADAVIPFKTVVLGEQENTICYLSCAIDYGRYVYRHVLYDEMLAGTLQVKTVDGTSVRWAVVQDITSHPCVDQAQLTVGSDILYCSAVQGIWADSTAIPAEGISGSVTWVTDGTVGSNGPASFDASSVFQPDMGYTIQLADASNFVLSSGAVIQGA